MPKKEASVSGFLSDNTESSIHGSILNSNNSFSPNLSIENETVLQDTSSISLQHLDNLSFYERVRTSANESDLSSIFSRGSLNGRQLKKIKRKPSDLSNRSALKKKLDDSNSDDSSSSINVSNIDDSFFKRPKDPGPKSPFSKSQRKSLHSKVSLDSSNETLDTKKNVRKKSPRKNKSQENISKNISVNLNSDSSSGSIDLSIIEMVMAKISSSPTKDFSPKRYGKTSPRKKSNRKRKLTELLDIEEVFNVPSLDGIKVDSLLQSPNLDETTMSEKSKGNNIINKKSLASQRVSVKLLESFFDSENENQDSVISPVKTLHMTKNCTLADFTFSESGSMNSFEGSISDSVDKKPKDDSITNERRKNLTSDLQINEATIPEALECNESSINHLTKELVPKKGLASHRVSVKLSEVLDDSELYDGTSVSFTRRTRKSLANSTVPDNDSSCSIKKSISDRGKSQKLSVQLSDDSVTGKKKMSSENCKSNEIQDNLDKPDESNQPQLGYESIQHKPRKSILRKNTRKSTVGNGASQPSEGYGVNIEEYNNLANDKKKNSIKTRKSSVQFKLDSSQTEDSNKNQTSKSILRRSTRKSVTFSTELSNLNEVNNEKEGNEVQKNKNTDKKINLTNARQSCVSEIDMELTNQDKSALSDFMDLTLKKSFTSQKVSVIAAENESSKNNSNSSSLKNVSSKCDINLGNDLESDTILTDHKRDDNDDSPNQFIQKAKVPLVKRKSSVHFELDETENNIINYTNVDEIHNTDHMNTMEEYAALGLTLSGKSYTTSVGIEMKEFTKSELTTNSGDANHNVDPGECNNLSVNDSLLDAMDVYMKKIKQKNIRSSNAALDGQGKSIQKINAITEQTINTSELCEIQKLKKCSFNETQLSTANSSITKSIFNGSSFDEDLPSSTLIENSRSALICDKTDLLPDKKKNITSEMGDHYTLGQEDKSLNCTFSSTSVTVHKNTRNIASKSESIHFKLDDTNVSKENNDKQKSRENNHKENNTICELKSTDIDAINKTQGLENLSILDDVSLTVDESVRSVTRKAAGKRASVHFNFDTTGADDETIGNNQTSQTSNEQNNTHKSVKSKESMGPTMNSIEVKDIPNDSDMEITNKTQGQENLSILDDVSLNVDESVRSVTRKAAGKRASVHFNFDTTGADDDTIGNNLSSQTSHEQNNTQQPLQSKESMGPTMNSIEVKDIPNDSDMEITNKTQGQENLSILDDLSLTVDESVTSVTRKAAGKRASVHFNFDTTGADDETIGNNQNSQTSHEQNNTQKSVKSMGSMGLTMNSIEVKDIPNDSDMEITNKTQGQENLSILDDLSLTVDESVTSVTRKAAGKRASVHFNFDTTGADDDTIGNNQSSQTSHEQNNTQKSVKSKESMGPTMNSIEVKDIPNDSDMEIINKTQGQENLSILDDVSLNVDESVRSVTRKAAGKRASVHFNFDTTGADDDTIGNNLSSQTSHEQNNTQQPLQSKESMGPTMNSIEVKDIPNDSDMEITNKTQGQENLSILDDVSLNVDESVRSVTRKAAGKRASVHFNFDTTGADDETIGNNQSSQTSHEQNNTQKSVKSKESMGPTMNSIEVKDIPNDSDMEITNKTQGQENLSILDDVSLNVDESVRSVTRKAAGKRASVHFNFDTTGADDDTIGNNLSSQTSHEQNNTQQPLQSKESMGPTMNSIEVKDIPNDSDMEIINKTQGQENLSILDDLSLTVDESVTSVTRKAAGKRASVHFNFDTTGADDDTIGNNQSSQTSHEQNNTQQPLQSKESMGPTMNSIEVKDIPNDSDMEITNKTQGQENLSILDDVSLTVDESVRSVTRKAAGKRASVHFNFDTTGADDETIGNNQNSQTSHEQNNTHKSVKSMGSMGLTMNSIEVKDIPNDSDMEITNKTQGQENLSILDDVSLNVDESVRSVTRKAAGKRASVHFNFDTTGADDDTIGNNLSSQTSHEQNNTQQPLQSKESMGPTMNSIEVKDIPNDSDMEITNKTQGQENLSILDDLSLNVDESVRSVTRKAAGKRASVHFNFDTTGADDETIGNNQNSQTSHEQNNTQKSVKSMGSMGLTMNSIEVKDIPNDSEMEITNKMQGQENLSILDDVSLNVDESVRSVTRKAAGKRASVHFNFDTTGADDETIGNNQNSQTSHEQNNTQKSVKSMGSMGLTMNSIEVKDIPNDSEMEITNKTQGQENLSISDDLSLNVDESVSSVTRKAAEKRVSVHFNFDTTGVDHEMENNQSSQTSHEQNNTKKSVKSEGSMGPTMNSIELKDIPNDSEMEITNQMQGQENLSILDDVSLNVHESVRSVTRKAAGKRASVHFNFDTTEADDDTIGNNQSSQTSHEQNNTQKYVKSKGSMGLTMNSIEVKDIPNDSEMEITNKTQGQENLSISDDLSLNVDESVRSVSRNAAKKRASVHFNFDTTGADDDAIGNNQRLRSSPEQNNAQETLKTMGTSMNLTEIRDVKNDSDMEITNNMSLQENLTVLDDVSLNVDESVRSVSRNAAKKRASVHFNFDTTGADDDAIGNNQSLRSSQEQNYTQQCVKSMGSMVPNMNLTEMNGILNDSDTDVINKMSVQETQPILDEEVSVSVDESVRSLARNAAKKRASIHFNFDTTGADDDESVIPQTSHEENNYINKPKGLIMSSLKFAEMKEASNVAKCEENLPGYDHGSTDSDFTNKLSARKNLGSTFKNDISSESNEILNEPNTQDNHSLRSRGECVGENNVCMKALQKSNLIMAEGNKSFTSDSSISTKIVSLKRVSTHSTLDTSKAEDVHYNVQKSEKSRKSKGLFVIGGNLIDDKICGHEFGSVEDNTSKTIEDENLFLESSDSILLDYKLTNDVSVNKSTKNTASNRVSVHFALESSETDDDYGKSDNSISYRESLSTACVNIINESEFSKIDKNLSLYGNKSVDNTLTNDISMNTAALKRVSVHFALDNSKDCDDFNNTLKSVSSRESSVNDTLSNNTKDNLSLEGVIYKSFDTKFTNDIRLNKNRPKRRVSINLSLDNSEADNDLCRTENLNTSKELSLKNTVNDLLLGNIDANILEGDENKALDTMFTKHSHSEDNDLTSTKELGSIESSLNNCNLTNSISNGSNIEEIENPVGDNTYKNLKENVSSNDERYKSYDTTMCESDMTINADDELEIRLGKETISESRNEPLKENVEGSISFKTTIIDEVSENNKEKINRHVSIGNVFEDTSVRPALTEQEINSSDVLEIRPGKETISESRNEPLKENVEGSMFFKTTIIDEVSENNKEKINRHVSIGNVFEDTSVRPALTEQEINSSDVLEIRPGKETISESRNEPLKENVEGSMFFKTTIIDEVSENNKEKINRHVSIGNVFEDTSVRPALTEQEINSSDVLEIRHGKETSESRNDPLKENVEGSISFKTTIIDEVSENNKEKINQHVSIGNVFEDTSVRPVLTVQEINSSDVLEKRPGKITISESRNEPLKENVEGSISFKTTIIDEVSKNNKEKINQHVSIGNVFEDTSVRPVLTVQEINSSDVLEKRPGKITISESRNEPLKENVEGSISFKTTITDEVSENNKEKINQHVSIGNVFEDTSVRPVLTVQEINSSDVLEIRPGKETISESRNEPLKENVEGSISFKTTIIDEVSENNKEKINRHVSIGNVFEDTSVRPALNEQEINSSDVLEIRPGKETSESRNDPLKENVEGSMFFKTTIIDEVSENNKEKINRHVSIGNVFEDTSVRPALTDQEINSSDVLEIRPGKETSKSRNDPLKENVEGSMLFKTTIIDEVSENNKEKINRHVSIGNVFEETSVRPALNEQEINSSDILEIRHGKETSESRNDPLKENVEGSMFFKTTIIDEVSENNKEKINLHVSIGKVFEDTSVQPALTEQEINSSDDVLEIRPGKETISEIIQLTKMSGDKETLNFNKSLVRFDKENIPTENVNESIVPKLHKEVEPNDNMNKKQSSYVKVGHGESPLQHIINESTISNIDRSILQSDRSKIKSSKENITNRNDSMNSECENTEYNDKKKNIHVSVGIKFDDTSVQHTMTDFTTFSKNTSDSQQNDYSSQALEEMKSKTINILTKNIPNEIHVGSSMDKIIDQNADGEKNRHVSVNIAFDETSIQPTIDDFVTFNTDTITSWENDNSKLKLKFIQPNGDLPTETEYSANENVGSTTLQSANELYQNNQDYKNCHVSEGVLFNETSCQPDSTTSDPHSSLLQEQPLINITKSSAIVSESLVNKDSNQSKFVDKLSVLNEPNSGDSSESNFTLFLEKDDSPAHSNLEINETPTKNVICDNLRCSNLKINLNSGEAFIEPEISKIRRNLDDETQSAIPEMYQGPCLYKDLTEPMTLSKPAFISDVLHSDLIESNGFGDSLNLNSIDSNVNRQNESLHCNKSVDNTANEILNNDLNKTEGKPVIVSDKSLVRITRSSLKKSDSSSTSVLTKNTATVLEKSEASCAVINSSSNKIKRKLSGLDLEHSFSPKKVILDISDHLQPPSLCDSDKITEPDIMPLKSNSFENLSHNVGRMSLSNPLPTSNCERNEKSISEALQDSQISSYTLSEKEVPNDLQTKRRRRSSRKSSNSPIEKETKEKCYNLRKSSPNVSANILMKRKSVTFGENIYLSPSEDSSSSTPPDQTTTSEAKTKVTNSKINLNSGEAEHVFIRPEIPSQKSKEASGSMSKTSRSNLDDDSQTKSYDTSLDLSEIPKDKTILNRKVIFHSTPIRPALERKKFKSTYKSFETTLDQKGTHSDGLIKVSNEVSGTSSGGTSLRSSKNKRSNTFGSPKHKTSEISTSYSNNNKNVKRKTECPDKNSSKRKKVSTNKHIDTSLFSSTAVGDSLDSGSQFDSYKTVRFKQNVQFKDVRASSCSTEKYSYRNQSTPSEISGRSYHSGSMMSTLTSKNSNVSLSWEDESSKHVRFRDRHSVIDAPDSLHDFPSSPSTIGNDTPTSTSIHQPERQEIRLSINRTYDSETYRRLSPAKNKDELSQKLIKSTSNGNISVSSRGRETDSEYAMSDCSAVREGMKYLIPFHIGPVRKVKKGLQLRNNDIFEESIFKKPKLQKYNFKNDPRFMINKQPYVEPKQKFPDKWVSKELYKFLIDKLKDSLDVNAHCKAERIIQYLCASVSSIEALNTPDDILLGTLLLRKLLVKHAICSNQLEYLSFIMRFTPFNFQKKILPLGKNLKVSDHVVPEAETIDINL